MAGGGLILLAGGIYGAYLTQGLVQERLSTTVYDGERFTHLVFLRLAEALLCFLLAGLLSLGSKKKSAPMTAFWSPGITNSIGPACGVIALKNISYPAQVLAKSVKMVPVMIMGTLIGGKRYSVAEYLSAVMIGGGIAAFAFFKASSKAMSKLAAPNAPLGYTLCAINLMLDGYTNAFQDKIKARWPDTSPQQMMCWTNFWCAVYYAAYMFGATTIAADAIAFCGAHPAAMADIALFCFCGSVGQLFIFYTIGGYGSLVVVVITTTRKFFNILLSVLWNKNPLTDHQWAAVVVVFLGLSYNIYLKQSAAKSKKARGKLP
mmetsp:Transcript_18848/g.60525  ORF Transcript_18848/g.60525 Transcript_18848/m.60525 type:complete len:319 (-) Transcript_18848:873-1829(-)